MPPLPTSMMHVTSAGKKHEAPFYLRASPFACSHTHETHWLDFSRTLRDCQEICFLGSFSVSFHAARHESWKSYSLRPPHYLRLGPASKGSPGLREGTSSKRPPGRACPQVAPAATQGQGHLQGATQSTGTDSRKPPFRALH